MRSAWADRAPLIEQRTRVARDALAVRPGRAGRFVYSNVGYVVVGAAIDRLAGEPYEAALRTHLLDPLGIRSLGYGPPPALCGHAARLRLGPWLALPGPALDPDGPRSDNPAVLSCAGTLHLTLADWATFVAMMLGDGANLLTPRSVERLFAPPAGRGPPMAMGWIATPGSARSTHAFPGSNTFWAATAMLDRRRCRAVLIACNDGRSSVLATSWALAERLIRPGPLDPRRLSRARPRATAARRGRASGGPRAPGPRDRRARRGARRARARAARPRAATARPR